VRWDSQSETWFKTFCILNRCQTKVWYFALNERKWPIVIRAEDYTFRPGLHDFDDEAGSYIHRSSTTSTSVIKLHYLRDSVLVWVVPMVLCLYVRGRCSVVTVERIELVLAWELFHLSYTLLQGNSSASKSKGTFLCNFVQSSRRWILYFDVSIVET